ncbi:hypothetical protein GQ44DRAFT_718264 [Phaeosphaeriaceae sp. PMI808]|nr:hypothetical protein GQ44DRAFT_718264 [Phaeosphaeriaceae sp. PMI808]
MPIFFDFPRELRDAIYKVILLTPLSSPSSPEECRTSRSYYSIGHPNDSANIGYECVGYVLPRVSCSALLLVNHQIHFEVREILDGLIARKELVYKLDCMIENMGRLYATPLLIPVITSWVNKIEIDIRFFGDYQLQRGCAALWGFSLVCFLNRFLTRGPNLLFPPKNPEQSKVYVDTIALNFLTLPEVPEWITSSTLLVRPGEDLLENREAGLWMVEREIHAIIDPPPMMLRENKTICEHAYYIRSLDDGKTRREWDVAEIKSRSATSPEAFPHN